MAYEAKPENAITTTQRPEGTSWCTDAGSALSDPLAAQINKRNTEDPAHIPSKEALLAQIGGKEPERTDINTRMKMLSGHDREEIIKAAETANLEIGRTGHSDTLKRMEDYAKAHPEDKKYALILKETKRELAREITDGVDGHHVRSHNQHEWHRNFMQGLH